MMPRLPIAAICTALAAWLGPPSPDAVAACQSWRLPPAFNAVEDSDFFVVFELKKTGDGKYKGPASYHAGQDFREVRGEASATLTGSKLDISVAWMTTPTGGYYTHYKGSIDSGGFIAGLRLDPRLPVGDKNREVFWKSRQKATCAPVPGGYIKYYNPKPAKPPEPIKQLGKAKPPKPIKKLGKAKTATVIADVDVYSAPDGNGNVLGVLRTGKTVSLLGTCSDNWCNVSGNAVPSGKGWVYNGADYRSLNF